MHHHYQHIAFCLTTGQPYNQLAILASGKGDELATVYYYCRRCVKIIIKDTVNCKKILQKIQIVTCLHTKTSNKLIPHIASTPGLELGHTGGRRVL